MGGDTGALDPRVRAAYEALPPDRRDRLAQVLARRAGRVPVVPRLHRTGPDQLFTVSPAQHRLWFLDQLRPGSTAYVVPLALELTGRLDAPALAAALDRLVGRHEALRTTYPARAGTPAARVARRLLVPLKIVDVCEARSGTAADDLRRAEAARPFDLARGPLVRTTLVRTGAETHLLLLTLHHIVADGWSLGILVDELAAFYRAALTGAPDGLAPLPVEYVDLAAWQHERLDGPVLASQLAGWRQALHGVPPLALPGDGPGGPPAGGAVAIAWPPELVAAVRALAATAEATLFMALLAALAVTVARWSGQEDLLVGTPVAGRGVAEAEPVVGFFVNTLPLRIRVSGDPTFRELLGRVRGAALAGFARPDVPYERIAAAVRPEAPLVRVLLALRSVPAPEPALPGLSLRALPPPVTEAKFDLTWECGPDGTGGLAGRVEYAAERYAHATVAGLHGSLTELLRAACRTPDARLSELAPGGSAAAPEEPPADPPRPPAVPAEPPRDAVERLIARVWVEVLEVDRVGAHDDFFALGGHSLLVTAAVARLQDVLGFAVPLDGALGATTIRDFAGYLRALGRAAGIDVDQVVVAERPAGTAPMGPRRLDRARYRR